MTPHEQAIEAVARALWRNEKLVAWDDVAPVYQAPFLAAAAALVAQITPLLTGPLQAQLADPVAVHANVLRGTIAKPSIEQIIHLYGRDALMRAMDAEKMAALTKEFPNV